MKWASAISEESDLAAALEECAGKVASELGPDSPVTLAVVFASATYNDAAADVARVLGERFPGAMILGCSGAGIIGNAKEIEGQPAVALTVGHLPDVEAKPFRFISDELPSPDEPPDAWSALLGVSPEEKPSFLVLMDPFSMAGEGLLSGLDYAFPSSVKVGGLASGSGRPGGHALFLGDEVYHDGVVGIALTGNIVVETVVAQGCRPIGELKRITKAERNLLIELDGERPLDYLKDMFSRLSPEDQNLVGNNLFLGIAMDPQLELEEVNAGDFLIRNLIGTDQENGYVTIGEFLREGQLVQFHIRDAKTSSEDLQRQLTRYMETAGQASPVGALMFQCNGRGKYLYGKENHDSDLFTEMLGSIPLGGFFCNGEIGQVSGTTYLHGYTSSFALFKAKAQG
ncbi:MAG: FIST C-terminal domain-containing protein [Chloroflexi bacterium]|nr:FIST C-terminal domain-containing protein [Chloroflexota bacterium]